MFKAESKAPIDMVVRRHDYPQAARRDGIPIRTRSSSPWSRVSSRSTTTTIQPVLRTSCQRARDTSTPATDTLLGMRPVSRRPTSASSWRQWAERSGPSSPPLGLSAISDARHSPQRIVNCIHGGARAPTGWCWTVSRGLGSQRCGWPLSSPHEPGLTDLGFPPRAPRPSPRRVPKRTRRRRFAKSTGVPLRGKSIMSVIGRLAGRSLLSVVVLAQAACGGGPAGSSPPGSVASIQAAGIGTFPTHPAATSPTPHASASAGSSPAAKPTATPLPDGTFKVSAREFSFSPKALEVKAGEPFPSSSRTSTMRA